MALISMTGYGEGRVAHRGMLVEVEVCSVNRRQLEVRVSLPKFLSVLESKVQEHIQHHVNRGAVNCSIRVQLGPGNREPALDEQLAEAYLRRLRKAGGSLGLRDDLGLSILLQLPDVLIRREDAVDTRAVWGPIETALDRALKGLHVMRRKEGRVLATDLQGRIKALETLLAAIRRLAPSVREQYGQSLKQRLEKAGIPLDSTDDRLLKELAIFAERCDISEEVVRLGSHLAQARVMLRSAEPVGRPLDFLCQELFREINTIGSKANDARLSVRVVDFKAQLERMREQVQNVE